MTMTDKEVKMRDLCYEAMRHRQIVSVTRTLVESTMRLLDILEEDVVAHEGNITEAFKEE